MSRVSCLNVHPVCQWCVHVDITVDIVKRNLVVVHREGALAIGQGYACIDLIDVNNEIISVHDLAA